VIDFIGVLGLGLLLAGLPVLLAQHCGASRPLLLAIMLAALAVCLVPWKGHSLVFYVRGIVGDISITSLVLLLVMYGRSLSIPVSKHQPIHGAVAWVLLAILLPLYASSMGYLTFDLYSWGYEPQWMLPASGLLLLWAWQKQPVLAIAWLVGIVSFACGLTKSRNLWDAMFDPFLVFAAVGMVAYQVVRMVVRLKGSKPVEAPVALRQAA
jgi:hypothetical protein